MRRTAILLLGSVLALSGRDHDWPARPVLVKVSNNVPQQPPEAFAAWCNWDITIDDGSCAKSGDWHDVRLDWTSLEPRNDAEVAYIDSYGGQFYERGAWPTPGPCVDPASDWFAESYFEWSGNTHKSYVEQRVDETIYNFAFASFTH